MATRKFTAPVLIDVGDNQRKSTFRMAKAASNLINDGRNQDWRGELTGYFKKLCARNKACSPDPALIANDVVVAAIAFNKAKAAAKKALASFPILFINGCNWGCEIPTAKIKEAIIEEACAGNSYEVRAHFDKELDKLRGHGILMAQAPPEFKLAFTGCKNYEEMCEVIAVFYEDLFKDLNTALDRTEAWIARKERKAAAQAEG